MTILALCLAVASLLLLPKLLGLSLPLSVLALSMAYRHSGEAHPWIARIAFWLGIAGALAATVVIVLFGVGYMLIPGLLALVAFALGQLPPERRQAPPGEEAEEGPAV